MTITITAEKLVSLDACSDQVERFREIFGDKLTFRKLHTFESAAEKHASDFDFDWAAESFLRNSAWAEYDKVCVAALAEYNNKMREAVWAEYIKGRGPALKVCGAALAEYNKVREAVWAEYIKGRRAVWAEYLKVRAKAFAAAYWKQEVGK